MAAIGAFDVEEPLVGDELPIVLPFTGEVITEDSPRLGLSRLIRNDNLQCNPSLASGVASQPDGREAPMSQLRDNSIPAIVIFVIHVNWVKSTTGISLYVLRPA